MNESDIEVVWGDPPQLGLGKGAPSRWIPRLAPFLDRPMEWGSLGEHEATTAANLTSGRYRRPPGRWEFTSRQKGCPKGRAILWARYLGPDEEPAS